MSGLNNGHGNGRGLGLDPPSYGDVQLPEDPSGQPPLDLSTALRPTPRAPSAGVALAATPASKTQAPVRLYGHALVPRVVAADVRALQLSMGQGLEALATPALSLHLEAASQPVTFAPPGPPPAYSGEDARAAYGFAEDDRLLGLPGSRSLEDSDWQAVYGVEATGFDWSGFDGAAETARRAPADIDEASLSRHLDGEIRRALSATRFEEPLSNLDALFETEPEPEDTSPLDEVEEEQVPVAANGSTALALEDIDRMFDEDFSR